MLDWIEYHEVDWFSSFVMIVIIYKVENVNMIVNSIEIILMVWLGVRDTKYENITSIPPI